MTRQTMMNRVIFLAITIVLSVTQCSVFAAHLIPSSNYFGVGISGLYILVLRHSLQSAFSNCPRLQTEPTGFIILI